MPTIKWKRPWLYPEQRAAIYDPARYSVIEASTKSGKTVGCIIWILELAMRAKTAGRNYWWVAPSYGQTKIAFRRAKRGLSRELYTASESELTITLLNGSVIWFKTGEKPDNLYGEDVYGVVIEEATRMREEAWHAIRSTITATRAPCRIIGNVKGRANWVYKMARRAEAGSPNMAYHKIVARDAVAAGILDADEVEDARRQLPENIFRELYEAVPSDDAGNPFGLAHIAACVRPLSNLPVVSWGWDLAKSQDWTVGIGLDKNRHCAQLHRWQRIPWEETVTNIRDITGSTHAMVDSTGVGDPIVERLQQGRGNFERFVFTTQSKQKLMEGLAVSIQHHEIGYPEGVVVLELESFEYEYTRTGVKYTAPSGMHDDCVMALGLANKGMPRRQGVTLRTGARKRLDVPELV